MTYAPPLIRSSAEIVVDPSSAGLALRDSCRLATDTTLPASTPAGSKVGKTLTADANGALSVDGVAVATSDRILVKNYFGSVPDLNNGIYTVTQTGDGSNPWILTRATDADEDAEVVEAMFTFVREGTVNANTAWVIITADPITVDTTAYLFQPFRGKWDAPTIAAGISLLPAGGGTIVLREGTHNVDTQIALPDKDIVFKGAGVGSTIISFTNNSPLFFTSTFIRRYTFEDIEFKGNNGVFQGIADCEDVILDFLRCKITQVEIVFDTTADTEIAMTHCEITSTSTTNWVLWRGGAGLLVWNWVRCTITDPSSLVMQDSPQWCVVNSYMTGGGGTFSTLFIGRMVAYSFRVNAVQLDVAGANSFIFGMYATDSDLNFRTNADDSAIIGCTFDYVTTFNSNVGVVFDAPARCKAVACTFKYIASTISVGLSCQNGGALRGHTVTGCTFEGTNIGLQFIDSDNVATGNHFSTGLVTPIDEFGSPNTNMITGNHGIEGSDTIGSRTTINGRAVRTISSGPVTLDEHDDTILGDTTGGTFTLNLPPVADLQYKEYTIKKTVAANTLTIDGDGAETIDGATTKDLTALNEFVKIVNDGTAWFIVGQT